MSKKHERLEKSMLDWTVLHGGMVLVHTIIFGGDDIWPQCHTHSCSLMFGCHASCPIIPVLQRLITYSTPLPSIPCTGIADCNILVFVYSYWKVMWPEHFIHPLLQTVCGMYRLCGRHPWAVPNKENSKPFLVVSVWGMENSQLLPAIILLTFAKAKTKTT